MADVDAKMKVTVGVDDQTKGAFENLGSRMKTLEGSTGKLSSAFTTLGLAGAAIYAATKSWQFFMEGIAKFQNEADIINLMSARLQSIGINSVDASPKIKEFAQSMELLGQEAEMVYEGVGKLSLKTKDVATAMELTKTAADLATSGYGTLADNTDRLYKIMTGGRGAIGAMRDYGIVITGTHTSAELLALATSKITRSTEQYAETTAGQIQIAKNHWENIQKQVGGFGTFMENDMVKAFNNFFSQTLGMGDDWGKGLAKIFNDLSYGTENIIPLIAETTDRFWDKVFGVDTSERSKSFYDDILKNQAEFEAKWNAASGMGGGGINNPIIDPLDTAAIDAAAKAIESSFTDIAKTAVASFRDQQNAINDLKKSITDLDKQLQSDLDKADENYKQSVTNLAKSSQDKITAIDKQISDEKANMSAGWRTRITDLEAEKKKEQDIIKRSGGEVSNLNAELAKDDLTILQEKHRAEVSELRDSTSEKKKTFEDEINSRLQFIVGTYQKLNEPGFFGEATSSNETFLRSIGGGSVQNVFNFNEMVAGDEGLKKLVTTVIDQLNRTAVAKNFGGQ